ncbi:MAG TPA: periplasmic heavy metal sensor [Candidatus Acidoferrales bacterium]|jgi:hypothetical protein|nr:periplasmic heavy metal sensor [Candidatus Acidoferrales bacterium]
MRLKTVVALLFAMSLSAFSIPLAAQGQAAAPPAPQAGQAQPDPQTAGAVRIGAGMPPQMMQMMGPMVRVQNGPGHGPESGGPLQMVSRLTTALDDASVRAKLGISDQEAGQLRKIVTDTEILTIQTGANIAVDSIELKELLRPDKPDKAAVMSKGDEISKATSALISHYLEAIVEAKTILTPEQQKKLSDYVDSGAPGMAVLAPAPQRRP